MASNAERDAGSSSGDSTYWRDREPVPVVREPKPPSTQDKAAAITRRQWDDYEQRILPEIERMRAEATDSGLADKRAAEARTLVAGGLERNQGRLDRGISRSGANLSVAEREIMRRRLALGQNLAQVSAGNTTRRNTRATQTSMMESLSEIGAGVSSNAAQSASAAFGMAEGRDQAYRAAKANSSNLLGAVVGGTAGFFLSGGNPMGAYMGATAGGQL